MSRRRLLLGAAAAGGALALPRLAAAADAFPNREITVIMPTAPGGGADVSLRGVLAPMGRILGVPMVVRNIANPTLATAQIASARPDGYTIGLLGMTALLLMPRLMSVPYKTEDFAFLGGFAEVLYGLGMKAGGPASSVEELIALAKTRRVTCSSNVIVNQLAMIQLGNRAGVKFHWVPTNAQAEAVAQVAGGHVDAVVQSPPEMTPLIRSGQIRFLASACNNRWPSFPEVKTLREMGYEAANFVPLGLACPTATSEAIREKLSAALAQAATDPETQTTITNLGGWPRPMTPEQIRTDMLGQEPMITAALEEAGMRRR
ncbi:tripartite tricarboxylate transporter substrate binding protein [Siccirubricoccus phaeus]|uniref:tripartite tricarboxylate transporter substrate binding protein n=1 Tax=Siccirubricoccus phaeus TaxID=2595053 RepID=UPI0011F1D9AC|nr:tripartite tricarboxylate transporter substrate binding protein [Siccirubricoccus phaeus]